MKKPSFSPTLNPELAARIRKAVEHLEMPAEALLALVFLDMARQCRDYFQSLSHEEASAYADGYAALARILLDADDIRMQPDDNYFKRFLSEGDRRHV